MLSISISISHTPRCVPRNSVLSISGNDRMRQKAKQLAENLPPKSTTFRVGSTVTYKCKPGYKVRTTRLGDGALCLGLGLGLGEVGRCLSAYMTGRTVCLLELCLCCHSNMYITGTNEFN